MAFNFTKPKLSPDLFACRYMGKRCGLDLTDHFADAFVLKNVARV